MTSASTPAGEDPERRLKTGIATAFVAADPVALVLPLVRRARGRTGVQAGPSLVAGVHAVVLGSLALRRPHPAGIRSARALVAVVAWCAVGPALLGAGDRTVVLRGRSPLWAYALDGLVRAAVVGGFLPALRRRQRASMPASTGSATPVM
ncbi:hypothetical protein [Geodermatophilus sp. SYSU D01105]